MVFTEDGTLITIHVLGPDTLSRFLTAGAESLGAAWLPSLKLLAAAMRACGKAIFASWNLQGYRWDQYVVVAGAPVGRPGSKRLRIDLAKAREHWLFLRLFESQAHSLALRCPSIPREITVAYVAPSDDMPGPFADESVVRPLREFWIPSVGSHILERLEELEALALAAGRRKRNRQTLAKTRVK